MGIIRTLAGTTDDVIEIKDRQFKLTAFSLAEIEYAQEVAEGNEPEEGKEKTSRMLLNENVQVLATALTKRSLDGDPVSEQWLKETLNVSDFAALIGLLRDGADSEHIRPAKGGGKGKAQR